MSIDRKSKSRLYLNASQETIQSCSLLVTSLYKKIFNTELCFESYSLVCLCIYFSTDSVGMSMDETLISKHELCKVL